MPRPRAPANDDVGIDDKVSFLASPAAYAEYTAVVEQIETHFSWVFLTQWHVYKLKKPVRTAGLDLVPLEARRLNAEAELRLNRRLAPDIYLAVESLTWHPDRGLAIGGDGQIVDWLVKMVRLPAAHMLDRRIADGDLHTADVHGLAERLAAFFAGACPAHLPPRAYGDRFRNESRLTCEAFDACGSQRQRSQSTRVARCIEAFITRSEPLLQQRIAHIVDGHGDLRPEHICLGSVAQVIDCLEFRTDLRRQDPVQELAFLVMECARLGAPVTIERILFAHYTSRTGDVPPPVLVGLYKAIAAFIRARIAILHVRDARDQAKWLQRAGEYLAIASRHAVRLGRSAEPKAKRW